MSAPVDVLAALDAAVARNLERGAAKGSPSDKDLRAARDAVAELIDAVESERVIWANEGKHPGWIGRVDSAKARTTAALARCKGGAA